MDVEQLHANIKSHIADDPAGVAGLQTASSGSPSRWSIDSAGLLRYDDRIWVPLVSGDKPDIVFFNISMIMYWPVISGRTAP